LARTEADTRFTRLKWRRAFDQWEIKLARWVEAAKSGFSPNQPRVPAGSREGGRWRGSGGGSHIAQASSKKPKSQSKKPKNPELKVPVDKTGSRTKKLLEAPPKVSQRRPATVQVRNRTAKEVAKWLDKARKLPAPRQIKLLLRAIEGISWFNELIPFVQSYLDGPKSLDQLNKDAQTKRPGYEKHHIVEQTPARQDGFTRDLIDAPENIVSVPTYKHHEISGHSQRKNKKYGYKSPREHLRGKSWEERRMIGLEILEEFGVFGP
jgi:hypothetical protein